MKLSQSIVALSLFAVAFTSACTTTDEEPAAPAPVVETPAKEQTPEQQLDEAIKIALDTVYFEFDSFALTPEAMDNLKSMAAAMKSIDKAKIMIEGHADERGSNEYNLALAQKRADAIKAFLVSEGVSLEAIETASFGEERPVSEGQSEEAYAKNRRGEFKRLD